MLSSMYISQKQIDHSYISVVTSTIEPDFYQFEYKGCMNNLILDSGSTPIFIKNNNSTTVEWDDIIDIINSILARDLKILKVLKLPNDTGYNLRIEIPGKRIFILTVHNHDQIDFIENIKKFVVHPFESGIPLLTSYIKTIPENSMTPELINHIHELNVTHNVNYHKHTCGLNSTEIAEVDRQMKLAYRLIHSHYHHNYPSCLDPL